MARGLNRVMIIGLVEREPELRSTDGGQQVASFCVSTRRHWTTVAGQVRESSEWFNVVAWGELADTCGQCLKKHQRLYVEGHLQTRSWEGEDGQRHIRTEVVAEKLIPMGSFDTIEARLLQEEACLNRVMVIGNLGRDPEMRYTPDGQAITSFSLATTRAWNSSNGGRRDTTEWFNVVAWGSLAEICHEYLSKGRRVYIEGELRTRGWEQPDGRKHFRTELVAGEMIMLGPRPRTRETGSDVGPGHGVGQTRDNLAVSSPWARSNQQE
ncbi:MAG: single-stranded DNA-binding protein [Anaerolineae bacterium]|nr:single-stranded DNA-binding protein [Anaerolineae bacterium]